MPINEQTGKPQLAEAERTRCECCDKGKIWEYDWTGSQHERDCTECMGTGIVQDKTAVDRSAAEREVFLWMYQFAGAAGAPVEALDNLSALSHGDKALHPWPYPAMPKACESPAGRELIAAATRAAGGLKRLGWPDEAAKLLAAIAAWEATKA